MTFMDETIDKSISIWDDCANEKFLNEMADGTLDKKKFYDYIIQDSIYLRGYLKEFAFAMTKASTLEEMKLYYSLLGYVNDGENVTRLNYLKECGMTDADVDRTEMRRQCRDYLDFLFKNAKDGEQEDILMATMPCMMGYNYVFEALKKRAPQVMEGFYAPLVADYTSDDYRECCSFWKDICNQKCGSLSSERKSQLQQTFKQASLHELYFCQMAGEDR